MRQTFDWRERNDPAGGRLGRKLLGDHPEALESSWTTVRSSVAEVLRHESVRYHFCRSVPTDAELYGHTAPTSGVLVALPGSANGDERHFADPGAFDVHHDPIQIFTFSFGPHFRLGASLARLEMRVLLDAVLDRFPEWSVTRTGPSWPRG